MAMDLSAIERAVFIFPCKNREFSAWFTIASGDRAVLQGRK
jgi:hypothetical protein